MDGNFLIILKKIL